MPLYDTSSSLQLAVQLPTVLQAAGLGKAGSKASVRDNSRQLVCGRAAGFKAFPEWLKIAYSIGGWGFKTEVDVLGWY